MKVTDLKENEVIHCETEEQAKAICKLMHEAGLTWASGKSYLDVNNYDFCKETCYRPKEGSYSDLKYYKRGGYTIYKAKQFLKQKTMTRTRVLFEEVKEKKLKPIEFVKQVNIELSISAPSAKPKQWEEIILIRKGYTKDGLDLIFAYDKTDDFYRCLYLGHWNDGVVEQ